MTRFVSPALPAALAAALTTALVATAVPSLAQTPKPERPVARQAVIVCATDAATRRAHQREFGVEPIFVTARETLAARSNGESWSTPRCMTEREYVRLTQLTQTRAGL